MAPNKMIPLAAWQHHVPEIGDNMNASSPSVNLTYNPEDCFTHPSPFLEVQFYVVCVLGTTVAAVSVAENLLVFYILFTRKYFWRRHYFYLMVIAVLDAVFSWAYIMVLSTIVFFEYTQNLQIMRVWYSYIVPGQTIVQVAQTSSTYLLVAASAEKFLAAKSLADKITDAKRFGVIAMCILMAIVMKGPLYFEIRVDYRPNCPGLKEYILMPSELLYDVNFVATTYNQIYVFWIRHTATVFLPFLILLILNAGIVLRDGLPAWCPSFCRGVVAAPPVATSSAQDPARPDPVSGWIARARSRVRRAATRTLVTMILTYLVSNGFGVLITAWEHLNYDSLAAYYEFYTYSSDVISILAVATCALRLPTYVTCDLKFRHEFMKLFASCAGKAGGRGSVESRGPNSSGPSGPLSPTLTSVQTPTTLTLPSNGVRKTNGFAAIVSNGGGGGGGGGGGTFGSFILREMKAKDLLRQKTTHELGSDALKEEPPPHKAEETDRENLEETRLLFPAEEEKTPFIGEEEKEYFI